MEAELAHYVASAQAFASRFAVHKDVVEITHIAVHSLELFVLAVFLAMFTVAALMKRLGRFVGTIAASVAFYVLAAKSGAAFVDATSFGAVPFYLTFDRVPVYLFCALPVVAFVADVVARESYRANVLLSGLVAALFNVLMSFTLLLLALLLGHVLVADSVLVATAKQTALVLALFQGAVTVAMQLVDVVFCHTKRLACVHAVLTAAAAVGAVFGLNYLHATHAVTATVLPLVERKIAPFTLADLAPAAVGLGVLLAVVLGFCAGTARFPSIIGALLYMLMGMNLCVLVLFVPERATDADHALAAVFASSPQGKVVVATVGIVGIVLTLLPAFNCSPIAESPRAFLCAEGVAKAQQKPEQKPEQKKPEKSEQKPVPKTETPAAAPKKAAKTRKSKVQKCD